MFKAKVLLVGLVLTTSTVAWCDVKCQFHLHSHFSDGFLTPRGLCQQAVARGVKVLFPLDHGNGVSSVDSPIKEIDLEKVKVDPKFVGIENCLGHWAKLAKEFDLTIITGAEYEIRHQHGAHHLGVIGITVELHEQMVTLLADKTLDAPTKVKRAFTLIRQHNALPLVAHPTLKMTHPESLRKITKEYKVTDYSFPVNLWQGEAFVLVEAMNHGNLDKDEDLVPLVFQADKPDKPSVTLVAGCDFHTWKAETLGAMIGNRLLGRPSRYPVALDRFTWIKTEKSRLTADEIIAELRKGNTYLTYGKLRFDPEDIGRKPPEYDEIPVVSVDFGKKPPPGMQYKLYRDDGTKPYRQGKVADMPAVIGDGVDENQFEFEDERATERNSYLLVFPGYGIVGPLRRHQSQEGKDTQAINQLRQSLFEFTAAMERFDMKLVPSRILELADKEVPAHYQFDQAKDSNVYLYVYLFNPDKGDVVEVRTSQTQNVARHVEAKQLDKPTATRALFRIALKQVGDLTIIVTAKNHDLVKTVKVKVVDSRQKAMEWKRVSVSGVLFEVPKAWYKDEGAARDPRQGYCGFDGQGNFLGVLVEEGNGRWVLPSAESYESIKVISRVKKEINGARAEIIDWIGTPGFGPGDITYRYRVILLGKKAINIEGELRHFSRQKEIFDKISSTIRLEK